MRQRVWSWACYWTREIRRLWVPIAILLIVGYWRRNLIDDDPTSELARLLYKALIVSWAAIGAHMLRSQIFPYINLHELMKNGEPLRFLGACILIGLFTLALILGVTMGL